MRGGRLKIGTLHNALRLRYGVLRIQNWLCTFKSHISANLLVVSALNASSLTQGPTQWELVQAYMYRHYIDTI